MDSDIRIVCIQVSPGESTGGPVSLSSSQGGGQRGEIRAVLEQAMESMGSGTGPGDRYEAHLHDLMSRALPGGKSASLPSGQVMAVSSEPGSDASNGGIVKATA